MLFNEYGDLLVVVFEGLFDRLSHGGFEGGLATETVEDNVGLACFWEEF